MLTPGLYITPLTDYGFKMVLGDEEIMREFLNDLLKPASPIRIYMDSLNNYRTVMAAKEYDFGRGMEKGIEKGIEKEKISNAKSMKALGLDYSIISQVTGLTIEEINAL